MNNITVCIPTYNRSDLLGTAINSVLRQDFKKFDILIIDNNSSDNTEIVVKEFKDNRIRFIKNKRNLGFHGNLQKCLDTASSKYIIFLADDDFFLQGALKKLYMALEENPSIIVGKPANFRFFGLNFKRYIIDQKSANPIILTRGDEAISQSLFFGLGGFSGLIIRKEDIKITITSKGDLASLIEPLFEFLSRGDFLYIPDILVGYRSHQNLAYKIYISSSYTSELIPLYKKYLKNHDLYLSTIENIIKFAIDDLYNVRLYAGLKGVFSEVKFIVNNKPSVKTDLKFIMILMFCCLLPKKFIRLIKQITIHYISQSNVIDMKKFITIEQ